MIKLGRDITKEVHKKKCLIVQKTVLQCDRKKMWWEKNDGILTVKNPRVQWNDFHIEVSLSNLTPSKRITTHHV